MCIINNVQIIQAFFIAGFSMGPMGHMLHSSMAHGHGISHVWPIQRRHLKTALKSDKHELWSRAFPSFLQMKFAFRKHVYIVHYSTVWILGPRKLSSPKKTYFLVWKEIYIKNPKSFSVSFWYIFFQWTVR
jgi:hypothetical protein